MQGRRYRQLLGPQDEGEPTLSCDVVHKKYVVNESEAKLARRIFGMFGKLQEGLPV